MKHYKRKLLVILLLLSMVPLMPYMAYAYGKVNWQRYMRVYNDCPTTVEFTGTRTGTLPINDTFNFQGQRFAKATFSISPTSLGKPIEVLIEGYNPQKQIWENTEYIEKAYPPVVIDKDFSEPIYTQMALNLYGLGQVSYSYRYLVCRQAILAMEPQSSYASDWVGATLSYPITLTNYSMEPAAFDLRVMDQPWPTRIMKNGAEITHTPTLADLQSFKFTVEVDIPDALSSFETRQFSLLATSQANPTIFFAATLLAQPKLDYQVEMYPTTSIRVGDPGTVVTHTISVRNVGGLPDSYTFSHTTPTWVADIPAPLTVQPDKSGSAKVLVHIPADATPGASVVDTFYATSNGKPAKQDQSTLTSLVNWVAVQPDTTQLEVAPGETASFKLVLKNLAQDKADTFEVVLESGEWVSETYPLTVGPIDPGQSQEMTFKMMVPNATPAGTSKTAALKIVSKSNAQAYDRVALTTVAKLVHGAGANTSTPVQSQQIGQKVTYQFEVKNTGNAVDQFKIEVNQLSRPSGIDPSSVKANAASWPIEVNPSLVTLEPGESTLVTVTITVPGIANNRETHTFGVTFTSVNDSTYVFTSQITLMVHNLSIFLPVVHK